MFYSTLMPSSSLTLRIIFTHISVILGNVGCSMQISLSIFMTLFLTLIPVSCEDKSITLLKTILMYELICVIWTNIWKSTNFVYKMHLEKAAKIF